tara:strand:+ start:627 stop:788 length:162 start_codon:yes stop_codon:yes gene_type:complete
VKIKLDRETINAIMKLAKIIILKEQELEQLRKTEDYIDIDDVIGPQKCENCND